MSALAEPMTAEFGDRFGPAVEPLPEDVVTEPAPWRLIVAGVLAGAVLLVWALAVVGLYLSQWRAEA